MAHQNQASSFGAVTYPIVLISPIVLLVAGRQVDLYMKVSTPAPGKDRPVILLSHGRRSSNFLSSLQDYGLLADFIAAHGFVVFQPTHLNSKSLGLDPNVPEGMLFCKSPSKDRRFSLDNLDEILSEFPGLSGPVDTVKVAAIGHSVGGHAMPMPAGMEVADPATGEVANFAEPRLKARVMLGIAESPAGLSATGLQRFSSPLAGTNFGTIKLPALVANGDKARTLTSLILKSGVLMHLMTALLPSDCLHYLPLNTFWGIWVMRLLK